MKLITLWLCLCLALSVAAQSTGQKKTDSVCNLVTKYLNDKGYDSLYLLTGHVFRSRVAASTFKHVAEAVLCP